MKTRYIWGLLIAAGMVASCEKTPLDNEQYEKSVYLAKVIPTDILRKVEIPYSDEEVETFISVACGGSLIQDQDVTVTLKMAGNVTEKYNLAQFPTEPEKHIIELDNDKFRIPLMETTLKKDGESYATIPVFIKNEGLDPDKTYAIPLMIDTVNTPGYLIRREISTILLGFVFTNPYKGNCSMEGTSDDGSGSRSIFGNKNLKAVNKNSVRLFAESYIEGTEADKLETECIILIFSGTEITVSGWKSMQASGSGTYNQEQNTIRLEYEFTTTTGTKRTVTENLKYNKVL